MSERLVCGNSNMHPLTQEDYDNGMNSRCTEDNPCDGCLIRLGREELKRLIIERDAKGRKSE